MHDWTRVAVGVFHAFHHEWISEISRALNQGLLPADHYALPEQIAAGIGLDVLTLQGDEAAFYRRRKSSVVVRHSSGDRVVAMIEIVSPGNKSNQQDFRAFVDKACELLERRIHLLIIDPFPPGPRDPHGVHAAIWAQIEDHSYQPPAGQPLTLVAYECDLMTRAYIEPTAVGQSLPAMPLFLEPNGCIKIPLEESYTTAFAALPKRWRSVLAVD